MSRIFNQDPNDRHLSCFQYFAIKQCYKLLQMTFILAQMYLRCSFQVGLQGCALPVLVDTATLSFKGPEPPPTGPRPTMLAAGGPGSSGPASRGRHSGSRSRPVWWLKHGIWWVFPAFLWFWVRLSNFFTCHGLACYILSSYPVGFSSLFRDFLKLRMYEGDFPWVLWAKGCIHFRYRPFDGM